MLEGRVELAKTPEAYLTDSEGRPYFLWDVDLDLAGFKLRLSDADPQLRSYWIGKLMRQAKPDDVFTFVSLEQITALWPSILPFLGDSRPFWTWWLERWSAERD